MAKQTQVVVLRVTWEAEEGYDSAALWNWGDLAGEECEVIAAGPTIEIEEEN